MSLLRNPPRLAAALAFVLTLCAASAPAQSGRKAQKPIGLPTETPKADDSGKPAETKKAEALMSFLVMKYDDLNLYIERTAQDYVTAAFFDRLRQANSIEVKDAGKGRQQDARDLAKKEEKSYVVLFTLDVNAMGGSPTDTDSRSVALRTFVYEPKTGHVKYANTTYQRPYQDTARVGGVNIPVPTRRIERYPSQHQLEQAARDAADRLLTHFQVNVPPRDN
jgi:hypothetical protein